jgi:hypothetical protein
MTPYSLGVFFRIALGKASGYVCIALIPKDFSGCEHTYFEWPKQADELYDFIIAHGYHQNVYFCPQLLTQKRLRKETIRCCPSLWSDLDTCPPDKLLTAPSLLVESSPGRFQALWALEDPMDAEEAEDLSRRIAYYHAPHGADRSGWDLTQLLRVPGTLNFKYDPTPTVKLTTAATGRYRATDFMEYPEVHNTSLLTLPLPEPDVMPTEEPLVLLQKYRRSLNPLTFTLFDSEPEKGKWSEVLWKMMLFCFEAGLSREEVFHVAQHAACNKYERDKKPLDYLWRDVCRAYLRNQETNDVVVTTTQQPDLLSPEEVEWAESQETFVERYARWATGLGDAAAQYHPAGAFVILSSLLAGRVRLPTSFGIVGLNLWFMILADTTLTRKSTAMELAIDLLALVDEDAILATDGSIEGLLTGLQSRSGRPSVFLRDEFSGLIEQMTKKDYMAGMAEVLTKLYDGKMQKRLLRKEVLTIQNPVLILFAGGIKTKIQQLLSFEMVTSGFVPRFIFVTAESSTSRMQPMGPPTQRDYSGRDALVEEMERIRDHYVIPEVVITKGQGFQVPRMRTWDAELSSEAWARYNKFEQSMMQAGIDSGRAELMTPIYDRLSKSTLKVAVLLAASRRLEEKVVVREEDVVLAISYCRAWRSYANEVINGVGKNTFERDIDKIMKAIVRSPGIPRSKLMQYYHLTARTADAIFATLDQRGLITQVRQGRGTLYYPIAGVGAQ